MTEEQEFKQNSHIFGKQTWKYSRQLHYYFAGYSNIDKSPRQN